MEKEVEKEEGEEVMEVGQKGRRRCVRRIKRRSGGRRRGRGGV